MVNCYCQVHKLDHDKVDELVCRIADHLRTGSKLDPDEQADFLSAFIPDY